MNPHLGTIISFLLNERIRSYPARPLVKRSYNGASQPKVSVNFSFMDGLSQEKEREGCGVVTPTFTEVWVMNQRKSIGSLSYVLET